MYLKSLNSKIQKYMCRIEFISFSVYLEVNATQIEKYANFIKSQQ